MQRSSNSARIAGVSLDLLASMITVVSSTTRQSAESIGEGFKTLFARMQAVAAGKDVDEFGESISNVEKVLENHQILLRDSQHEFRAFGDIMDDIHSKWDSLGTVQQAEIAGAIAGVRQRERFLVLMNEWNQVKEAEVIATDSAGLAQERYGIYLESVQAKMNQFKATWEEFWMKSINSGTIKTLVDIGKGLLNIANKMGGINSILVFLPAILAKINLTSVITKIKEAGGALKALRLGFSDTAMNAQMLAAKQAELIASNRAHEASLVQLSAAQMAANKAAMITNWVTLGLAIAGVAVNLYNAWKEANSLETAMRRAEEATRTFEETQRQLQDKKMDIVGLEKILKEYDELKNKTELTSKESERFYEIQKEISEIVPGLSGEYDSVGRFMLDNKLSASKILAIEKERLNTLIRIEALHKKEAIEAKETVFQKTKERMEELQEAYNLLIDAQNRVAETPGDTFAHQDVNRAMAQIGGFGIFEERTVEKAIENFTKEMALLTEEYKLQGLELYKLTGDTEKYGMLLGDVEVASSRLGGWWHHLEKGQAPIENVKTTLKGLVDMIESTFQGGDRVRLFSEFSSQILAWQKLFEDGKISIENYFSILQEKINETDLSKLFSDGSDGALNFLRVMAVAASDALMHLDNKFEEGNLSINDYMQGLLGASDAVQTQVELLLEHAEAAGLSAEEIAKLKTEYEEFSNNLTLAQEELIATMPLAQSITAGFADAMSGAMQVGSDNWNHWISQMIQDAWAFHNETGAIFRDSAGNILSTVDAMGQYAGASMQAMEHFASQAAGHISGAVNGTLRATEEGMRLVGNTISKFEVELIPSASPGVDISIPISDDLSKGIREFKFNMPRIKLSGTANVSTYVPATKNFGTEIFMPGGGGYKPPSTTGGGGGGRGDNEEARRQEEERKKAEKAYQDLLKMTIAMLKHRAKEAIRALKEEVKAYKELIDKKKDLIDQEKRERDLAKDKANREKVIADLQAELAEAMFDDSEAGIARRLELEEELYKKQEEMADFNYENSVDARKRALDQMYEDFKEAKEKEIEALEEYLRKEGEIVQEALELIEGRTQEFYDQLMEWNMTYGSGIAQDVIDSWKGAIEWIDVWKRGAIEAISAVAAAGGAGAGSMNAMAGSMKNLGEEALDAAAKVRAFFSSLGGGGYMLPIGRVVRTEYHDGGIVGGAATLQETEVFAKLLKGEVVVTQGQAANFMRNTLPNIANSNENTNNFTFNVPIQIHGEVGRNTMNTIKSSVFDGVSDALMKAGIKSNANTFGIG